MNKITPASEKQHALIERLVDEKQLNEVELNMLRALVVSDAFDVRTASRMIDTLMAKPRKAVARVARAEAPEGMHRLPDGKIYKVQRAVHGSGNLYAKRLDVTVLCPGHLDESAYPSAFDAPLLNCADVNECPNRWVEAEFVYARGAMRLLSESTRMSKDEAKAFGALYGICASCSKTLTREDSIKRGYGSVCAKKFA